jgi:hypothetical protein
MMAVEVSGHLVGSAAFKAVGTGDPCPAGSIPVHLRHHVLRRAEWWEHVPGAARATGAYVGSLDGREGPGSVEHVGVRLVEAHE